MSIYNLTNEQKENLVGQIFHQLSTFGYLNDKGNEIGNDSSKTVPKEVYEDIIKVISEFLTDSVTNISLTETEIYYKGKGCFYVKEEIHKQKMINFFQSLDLQYNEYSKKEQSIPDEVYQLYQSLDMDYLNVETDKLDRLIQIYSPGKKIKYNDLEYTGKFEPNLKLLHEECKKLGFDFVFVGKPLESNY